MLLVADEY